MAKKIAVISYDTNPASALTQDALFVQKLLTKADYPSELVHQWSLNETDPVNFKTAAQWQAYRGAVICGFYGFWNLRELILSKIPVLCLNSGYVDDLGLGERQQEHVSENSFTIVNNTHPITAGLVNPFNIGAPVWLDSTSCGNHHVKVLVNTLANQTVLAAHKTLKLTYFGWYRMSQTTLTSPLSKLFISAARWTFV